MAQTIAGIGAKPRLKAPPKACDCHSHIFGPPDQYPYAADHKGPPPVDASLEDYRATLAHLGIERSVIVHTIAHGYDNARTTDAIREIGLDRARGVAICPPDIPAAELRRLHDAGIRGFRVPMLGGIRVLENLGDIARRIAPLGWHLQIQREGGEALDWLPLLHGLPVPVVIDHIARMPPGIDVDRDPRFLALLRLLETGNAWLKLSGPYYGSAAGHPYADVAPRIRALVRCRPDRLVWALNWPHPSFAAGSKPDAAACLDMLLDGVPDAATRDAILADNPARLYDFPD